MTIDLAYFLTNHGLDRDAIRDDAQPGEVIYYSECDEVIRLYESDHWREAEALTDGLEFKASEWQQAQVAYCNALKYLGEMAELEEQLERVEDQVQDLLETAEGLGFDGGQDDVQFTHDCPHGWAVHNRETDSGIMIWSDEPGYYNPELLEGELVAVSVKLDAGCYATLTWTPEREEKAA